MDQSNVARAALWKLATQDLPVALFGFDASERTLFAEGSLLSLWAIDGSAAAGVPAAELLHRAPWLLSQLRTRTAPEELPAADGRRFEVCVGPAPNGGVVCIVSDVTAREAALARVGEGEQRFQRVAEGAPAKIWTAGPDGRREWFNKRWRDFTGRELAEDQGDGWMSLVHPEDLEGSVARYSAAVADATEVRLEHRMRRKDGAWRWLVDDGIPIFAPGGTVLGYVGACLDVTGHREAAVVLADSEARFRQLADCIPQLVFSVAADGNLEFQNQRLLDRTGLTRDADREARRAIVHIDDRERLVEAWSQALASGEPFTMEARYWDAPTGIHRWYLVRALAVRDGAGRILRWLGTCTDIHAQKLAEEALRAVLRSRDEFISMASHELKTPLTALKLQAQITVMQFQRGDPNALAPDRILRVLRSSEEYVDRLASLVDDMLEVSRANMGRLGLSARAMDLCDLTRRVAERFEDQLRAAGSELRVDTTDAVRGVWDAGRLEQVLGNLLSNAAKYGAGKPLHLRVFGEESDGELWAVLTLQDQGIGIAASDHARVFERFERAVSGSEVSGLGLGLFISSRIVAAHGGTLAVESEAGRGATFTMRLPRRAAPLDDAELS